MSGCTCVKMASGMLDGGRVHEAGRGGAGLCERAAWFQVGTCHPWSGGHQEGPFGHPGQVLTLRSVFLLVARIQGLPMNHGSKTSGFQTSTRKNPKPSPGTLREDERGGLRGRGGG